MKGEFPNGIAILFRNIKKERAQTGEENYTIYEALMKWSEK